jgi:hypothetical protein
LKWRGIIEDLVDLGGCIRLLVLIVVTNVKYRLSQLGNDQYIVVNVLQNINVQESEEIEKDVDLEIDAGSVDLERCTRQFVVTVVRIVKFLLNLLRGNQSIVRNVLKSIDLPDVIGKQISSFYKLTEKKDTC